MSITQTEHNYLIQLEKKFETNETLILGPPPMRWSRVIKAVTTKDTFLLDYYRGRFELLRYTYNKRYRQTIVLLRFDSMGRHTNPDGVTFEGPHIHIYREGFDDKFAFPVSTIDIREKDEIGVVLTKFLEYCCVRNIPNIQTTAF